MERNHIKSNVFRKGREIIGDFISLFYPNYCFGCTRSLVKGEDLICTHCILDLPKTGYSFITQNPILEKFEGRIPIKEATAYLKFRKTGIVQKLLHQLKYQSQPDIGLKFGKLLGKEMHESGNFQHLNLIIPVPLHPSKEKQRGYNQSAKIAQGLAEVLNIQWHDAMIRKTNTQTQTRKNRLSRWQNVETVFDVKNQNLIEGKSILLVDDVMTTGATLEACGRQLLNSGCQSLSIACIAEA